MTITTDPKGDCAWRERVCTAVEGYLTLDLPDLALEELEELPVSQRNHLSVLAAKVAVFIHLGQWKNALMMSRRGSRQAPDLGSFYFHSAFCLHELGRTQDAKKALETAPLSLRRDPLFHYNLGCYLSVLGKKAAARTSLDCAFKMDGNLRECALKDPDLRVLWPVL